MTQLQKFKSPMVQAPTLVGISEKKTVQLVGLRQRIQGSPSQEVPGFWKIFSPYRGWIPGQVDKSIYGALLKTDNGSEGFDYLTAVEVSDLSNINSDWDVLKIFHQRYSVFLHKGHVSELRQTQHAIFSQSLPALNMKPRRHARNVPLSLERYDHTYNLGTGWGGIQIWVPIEDD